MDKNPNQNLDNILIQMKSKFSEKNPNLILCSKPFLKTEFLNRFIDSESTPVIFLDFDLLYSGYVNSGLIKKNKNITIFHSTKINWEKDLKEIIEKITREKVFVILDSLNGVYNMFDELESARFINAVIMFLSSISRYTKSQIIITAFAIKNENNQWVLSPGGRRLPDSKNSGLYYLGMSDTGFIFKINSKKDQ